ncbi:MAG: single-stranded DNA-binding protein [Clostridia bacterium]|nr:single-stranded DNA-binding protein [Clostridia bacterium]
MASANKVILMGNMTVDSELRQTQSGKFTCSFSLAVNRRFGKATDFLVLIHGIRPQNLLPNTAKKENSFL